MKFRSKISPEQKNMMAAPALLNALVKLLAMCERQTDFNDDSDGAMLDRAKAAIEEATGGTA